MIFGGTETPKKRALWLILISMTMNVFRVFAFWGDSIENGLLLDIAKRLTLKNQSISKEPQ